MGRYVPLAPLHSDLLVFLCLRIIDCLPLHEDPEREVSVHIAPKKLRPGTVVAGGCSGSEIGRAHV